MVEIIETSVWRIHLWWLKPKIYPYITIIEEINVLALPYKDEYFDLIICNHVSEHIEEDLKVMREIKRVMKRTGAAILQVPISENSEQTFEDYSIINPIDGEIYFWQKDHVRIYGKDYIDRLKEPWFVVETKNISEEYEKYWLNKKENIFICKC